MVDGLPFVLFNSLHTDEESSSRMSLATLSLNSTYREVSLVVKGAHAPYQKIERNWQPFVLKDKLYVTYSLCPHVVLSVDMESGICAVVSKQNSSTGLCALQAEGQSNGYSVLQGSTNFLSVGELLVGVVHRYSESRRTTDNRQAQAQPECARP